MTRRKVDPALVDKAFALREQGASVADILAATGLSQGTYYAYLHAYSDSVDRSYATQPLGPILTWPGSKRDEIDELLPHVPRFRGRYTESFLGGASMFFALKPERALLSDANAELVCRSMARCATATICSTASLPPWRPSTRRQTMRASGRSTSMRTHLIVGHRL